MFSLHSLGYVNLDKLSTLLTEQTCEPLKIIHR